MFLLNGASVTSTKRNSALKQKSAWFFHKNSKYISVTKPSSVLYNNVKVKKTAKMTRRHEVLYDFKKS